MKITVIQNTRHYLVSASQRIVTNVVNANQTIKEVKVTLNPSVKRNTIVTVSQLGKRGFKGISAYESALEGGFIGTELEWANSLKGDKGDTGYTPIKGVDYFNGDKGDKGDIGLTPNLDTTIIYQTAIRTGNQANFVTLINNLWNSQ
jgi:hypothetical protein